MSHVPTIATCFTIPSAQRLRAPFPLFAFKPLGRTAAGCALRGEAWAPRLESREGDGHTREPARIYTSFNSTSLSACLSLELRSVRSRAVFSIHSAAFSRQPSASPPLHNTIPPSSLSHIHIYNVALAPWGPGNPSELVGACFPPSLSFVLAPHPCLRLANDLETALIVYIHSSAW